MNQAQVIRQQEAFLNQLFANRERIFIPPFYNCCVPVSESLNPGLFTHRVRLPVQPRNDEFNHFNCDYAVEHKCHVDTCFLKPFRFRVRDDPNPGNNWRGGITYEIQYDGKTIYFEGDTFYALRVNWDVPQDPNEPRVLKRDKDKNPDGNYWKGQREYKFGSHSAWIEPSYALNREARPARDIVYPDMHELARAFEPMMFGPNLHPICTLQAWLCQVDAKYPRRAPIKINFEEEDY